MEEERKLPRTLMGGTRAMRLDAETFLPLEPNEGRKAYNVRLRRTYLYPGLRRTVETFVGKALGQPIDVSGVAAPLRKYLEDIDLMGNNITVFARKIFEDQLVEGLGFILVDNDVVARQDGFSPTLADAQAQGARPYFVRIPPQNVIGWRAMYVQGEERIARVRIREAVPDPVNEWDDDTTIEQVRVIEPMHFWVYRSVGIGDAWQVVESGVTTMDDIPLVPLYGDKTGFFTSRPTLMDLASLNLCHWQSYSDQRNILRVARVPILFGKGFNELEVKNQVEVGPNIMRFAADPQADMHFVEHSGAAIEAGRNDLRDLEEKMAALGTLILNRVPGDPTATKTAVDTAESGASLSVLTQGLEDALNTALYYMARWIGMDDGGTVRIQTDLPAATEAGAVARNTQRIPRAAAG